MTKIKLDIESDENLTSATVQLKYKNGKVVSKDVITEGSNETTTQSTKTKSINKKGVDSAFTQVY